MGLCFSKKKKPPPGATSKKPGKAAAAVVTDDKAKKTAPQPKGAANVAAADKNAVKVKAVAAGGDEKKTTRAPQGEAGLPVVVVPSAPVRTSSCSKEEVDAILIQCGRLSRSSSGTGRTPSRETGGGGESGGHRRRRSGSKRSYDFDQERKAAAGGGDEEGDWESRPVSRPSPHRSSPQQKRSGSRERSGGGGNGSRRASRSPGRRGAEGGVSSAAMASSAAGERGRQPGKMVSVPAREKTRAPSPAAASGIRCASPRSSSPTRMAVGNENAGGVVAAGPGPVLSRSSSRKAEQSPYRRNPMAELDENTLRNTTTSSSNGKPQKKFIDNTVVAAHQKPTERVAVTGSSRSAKEKPESPEDATAAASDTRAPSSKTNATRTTASVAAESLSQRPRSRRASRDFDQCSSNSYASQILEDIQNYHEQHHQLAAPATPSFSLPACVAKACSILEAVADLNSSSSSSDNNRTYDHQELAGRCSADDKGSVNAASGTDTTRFVARRHVLDVRAADAAEPQESAGSNSVSAIPCTPSWEPASVESTDRTWSAGDDIVDQGCGSHGGAPSPMMNRPRQSKQRPEPSGGRSRAGSGNGNSLNRGRAHRGSGSVASGRSGVRTVSAAS